MILAGLALVLVLAALLLVRSAFAIVTVEGRSMEPALHDGDRVLVRRGRPPRRDEVAVFRRPGRPWTVKRVAAVPGDPVPPEAGLLEPVVPPGRLVVLGDNRAVSHDSRGFGYVDAASVLGVVTRKL